MRSLYILFIASGLLLFNSCKKEPLDPEDIGGPYLIMYFDLDSTMARYDNFGQPVEVAAGNAAQHPIMHSIAAHYVEFTPNPSTLLGHGEVVYDSPKTVNIPGEGAIIFDSITPVRNKGTFLKIPLKNITPGTYEYLRVSIAYENYDIVYHIDTTVNVGGNDYTINQDFTGRIANFLGFNNYIKSYKIKDKSITVNGERKQGYFGFESNPTVYGVSFPILEDQSVPEGATTVPNVLSETSPIPYGSCIITGDFENGPFKITGKEKKNIKIRVKVSTNQGFEWEDLNGNGKYDPLKGEKPVDMGVRGIKGVVEPE